MLLLEFMSAANRGPPPLTWTFTASSTDRRYSGETGTQSIGSGGLADGDYVSVSSVWASSTGTGEYLSADFGGNKEVSRVYVAPLSGSVSLIQDRKIQYSTDNANWVDLVTIGAISPLTTTAYGAMVLARYVRVYIASGVIALGEFYFD